MSAVDTGALRSALVDLSRAKATGQFVMRNESGEQACLLFHEGRVINLRMTDHRPRIGMRLVAAGMLSPDQLAAALATQREKVAAGSEPGRIGDVLVSSGAVTREVVERVARTQMADNLAGLLAWSLGSSTFEATAGDRPADPGLPVDLLLVEADARRPVLQQLLRRLGGPGAIPDLIGLPTIDPHPTLGPHDWALLCKIDGRRSLAALAEACGFTMLEAAQTLDGLMSVGLATVGAPGGASRPAPVDTAALLRELSSLASDGRPRRRRPATPAAPAAPATPAAPSSTRR